MNQKKDYGNDFEIEDVEEYRGGKGASFKEIVLRHFSKCMTEGSKAMDFGGVQIRTVNGVPIEIVVPNQVEIFINSTEMLKSVLEAKIGMFEDRKRNITILYKNIGDLEKRFATSVADLREEFSGVERKTSADYAQLNRLTENLKRNCEYLKYFEYRKVFTELSLLLSSLNYFEEDSVIWEPSKDAN